MKTKSTFLPKVLFGVLLNPSLKGFLKGYILLPQMGINEAEEVTFVEEIGFVPCDKIPYPENSSFVFDSGLVPILLPAIDDPAHRDQAFSMLCSKLLSGNALKAQNNEPWFALTDLKRSGDAVAFCGSYDMVTKIMGAPMTMLKDPIKSFKVLLPPSRLNITGGKGLAIKNTIRLALADLNDIKTDGGIISCVALKHADYDKEGKVGPMRHVKYSYQIRHNTVKELCGHKKGKVTYDPALHRYLCYLAGIDHRSCDMIMAIDDIKSAHNHEIGDIVEIPINELRVIKMKERQSPTRGGAQIRRIAWAALRQLMAEKGSNNVAAATVMRYASYGDAHAIAHILQVPFAINMPPVPELKEALTALSAEMSKDTKAYFEDGLGLFIQLLAAAKLVNGPSGQFYQVPMYGDPFSAIMGRLRAWYFDRVIKIGLGDFSFYVEVAPHLKGDECLLPNVPALLEIADTEGIHLTGMRPPIVSRANLQPLAPKRDLSGKIKTNRTDDTIYVSAELLLAMFGDTDGDMLYIIHSKTKFKFRPRLVTEEEKVKYLASTPRELCDLIRTKSSQVAQASLEVGLRDRAASILYDERQLSGTPITDDESMKMADEWLENAIKSFKHDGTSIMGEQAIGAMCQEYGTDLIRRAQQLPKKSLPQTQLFRRKIGAFGPGSGSDKMKMKSLAFELTKFFTHKPNVELGVCKPGNSNTHPYLPVFSALKGFVYEENLKRALADHNDFTSEWNRIKGWLDSHDKRLQYRIIDVVRRVESLYNSSASFAITLSSYTGEKHESWWPFCIYTSIKNRRDWATYIATHGMMFEFTKVTDTGYVNKMKGTVTMAELYELLATGRINTLQKRARFRALREAIEKFVEEQITALQNMVPSIDRNTMHKCIAVALGYRVFGIRVKGGAARNAREFMSISDDIKLSVYNSIFKSPWGSVARKAWDCLTEYYAKLEDEKQQQDEEISSESVDEDNVSTEDEEF